MPGLRECILDTRSKAKKMKNKKQRNKKKKFTTKQPKCRFFFYLQ
jgi:hypothetical protein